MKKTTEMTHKEAVKNALEMLGGKAQLKQIYPVAIKLIGNNTQSKDIKATIRRELNSSPLVFKSTPGQEGSWELLFYQEELAKRDEKIAELQNQLNMATLRESQVAQNAFIQQGFSNEVDQLYNRLSNCPVPSTPVYGRTPIFTCDNNGCGCGCGMG